MGMEPSLDGILAMSAHPKIRSSTPVIALAQQPTQSSASTPQLLALRADIHPTVLDRLGSGKLRRQHQPHVHLQEMRADNACEFLRTDAKFIGWHRGTGCRELVIVGELGSGKSVAMAFLVDELHRRNQLQVSEPNVPICYHYCQNGTSGEAIHVFCVLILSLLAQRPDLKMRFVKWCGKFTLGFGIDPATSFKALEE